MWSKIAYYITSNFGETEDSLSRKVKPKFCYMYFDSSVRVMWCLVAYIENIKMSVLLVFNRMIFCCFVFKFFYFSNYQDGRKLCVGIFEQVRSILMFPNIANIAVPSIPSTVFSFSHISFYTCSSTLQ